MTTCLNESFHGKPFRYCPCGWIEPREENADDRRTIRPRTGDLEAATRPHPAIPSGEFAGPTEVCDLCGLSIANRLMHPERHA